MSFLLTALAVTVIMVAAYLIIHKFAPSWGTLGTNGLGGLILLLQQGLDLAASLPWGSVLEQAQAAAVMFGVMAANGIMRLINPKKSAPGQ